MALDACDLVHVRGTVWRFHTQARDALDPNGYRFGSGRFHRGEREFGIDNAWPAIYLSSAIHLCLGETLRHLKRMTDLRDPRLSEIEANLSVVFDCTDLSKLGLAPGEFLADNDFVAGQRLAAAARGRGAEGLIAPSATGFEGFTLVYFPDMLRHRSTVRVVGHQDPNLYVRP